MLEAVKLDMDSLNSAASYFAVARTNKYAANTNHFVSKRILGHSFVPLEECGASCLTKSIVMDVMAGA